MLTFAFLVLLSSYSFELNDPFVLDLLEKADRFNDMMAGGFPADFFPILRFLPNKNVKECREIIHYVNKYLDQCLQEHRETYDPGQFRSLRLQNAKL